MNRLKDLRDDTDLKQEDVSLFLNISRSLYSQYETENLNISNDYLRLLSNFYNTSIDYILYRTDDRSPYRKSNLNVLGNMNMLKELRKSVNKTQKQVSEEVNIPLKSYIKYENGERSLNIQLLNLFADYYSTSIDFIVCNTNDIAPHKRSIVDWNF